MTWYFSNQTEDHLRVAICGSEIGIGKDPQGEELLSQIADAKRVHLLIDCGGGNSIVAAKLYAALRQRETTAHISGRCCSAAVSIICAAKRVTIEAAAKLMLHPAQACAFGPVERLRRTAAMLEKLEAEFIEALIHRTRQPVEVVSSWLGEKDFWLNAEEAKAAGLVDEILAPATTNLPPIDTKLIDTSAAQPTGPTADEQMLYDLISALPKIEIRDRKKFAQNLNTLLIPKLWTR